MNKQKIVILDFRLGEVHIHNYNNPDAADQETIIEELGHNPSDCEWLITDEITLKMKEKQGGRAFVGYSNDTPHYLFRKHKLMGKWHFDIENENLIYSDSKAIGMHGMQCNFSESKNPEKYQKLFDLCQKASDLLREIDELNTK